MSTNKTPRLNMNSWVSTDYVNRNEFNDNFTTIDTEVGALKDKVGTSTVAQQITDKVGDITTLATTDKSSIVAAVNELKTKEGSDVGDLSTLTTTVKTSAVAAINENHNQIGSLSGLYNSTTNYTYTNGNLTQMQEVDSNNNVLRTTTYTYNALNKVATSVETFNGHTVTTTFNYDASGNITSTTQSYT
jgi:hypothetical protein